MDGNTYLNTLQAFLALAKSAEWPEEEQVRSILVSLDQLIDDGDLPPDTIDQLFFVLRGMVIAEANGRAGKSEPS